MEYQSSPAINRTHPLMLGAAASVVLVSLLGAAAITGLLPSSHSTVAPTNTQNTAAQMSAGATETVTALPGSRFITSDGRVLQEVASTARATAAQPEVDATVSTREKVTPVRQKIVRHAERHQQVALNEKAPQYRTPARSQPAYQSTVDRQVINQEPMNREPINQVAQAPQQPIYQPQSQPQPTSIFGNVNPVQTGVGAVIGGLLGSQVGKGNGRTLATVAGVIAGGYAGNEISHGRSPVPTW